MAGKYVSLLFCFQKIKIIVFRVSHKVQKLRKEMIIKGNEKKG